MINIRDDIKVHNRYDVQVVDAATGRVKQEAHAENAVLNNIWELLFYTHNSFGDITMFSSLGLGTGSGTPSASDTDLFRSTGRLTLSESNTVQVSRRDAYPTSSYVYSITVPATSTWVGNFTEIGMRGSRQTTSYDYEYFYWSHALFEDSEGNPITVNKTDLDVLIVTFTLYVTLGTLNTSFSWVHPRYNELCKLFSYEPWESRKSPFNLSSYRGRLMACTCCPSNEGTIRNWTGVEFNNGSKSSNYTPNIASRSYSASTMRLNTSTGNNSYYHGIVLTGVGGVTFPNADIFPARTLSGLAVGNGDGVTKDFNVPVSLFIAGSDKVYVNGAAVTRDVDYAIDSASNVRQLTCLQPSAYMFLDTDPEESPFGGTLTSSNSISFPPFTNETVDTDDRLKYLFNTLTPLVYKFAENSPLTKFDTISIGSITRAFYFDTANPFTNAKGGATYGNGATCYVDVSDDGAEWTRLGGIRIPNGSLTLDEPVTTKYIRFTLDKSTASYEEVRAGYALGVDITSGASIRYNNQRLPLRFVNAPEPGVAITMDVTVDRPYKTDQFVLDAAMSLTFGS